VRRREEGYHLYPGESLEGPSRITIQNKQFTEGRTIRLKNPLHFRTDALFHNIYATTMNDF
jgi:hypothetical protein